MPIYDYKCKKCGHRFEGKAKIVDPNPSCPQLVGVLNNPPDAQMLPCGGETEKLITSAARFHLKGGGWAEDGYCHQRGPGGNDLSGVGREP